MKYCLILSNIYLHTKIKKHRYTQKECYPPLKCGPNNLQITQRPSSQLKDFLKNHYFSKVLPHQQSIIGDNFFTTLEWTTNENNDDCIFVNQVFDYFKFSIFLNNPHSILPNKLALYTDSKENTNAEKAWHHLYYNSMISTDAYEELVKNDMLSTTPYLSLSQIDLKNIFNHYNNLHSYYKFCSKNSKNSFYKLNLALTRLTGNSINSINFHELDCTYFILDSVIALEALFGDRKSEGVVDKLINRSAIFLGDQDLNLQSKVKSLFIEIYKIRSKIIHGSIKRTTFFDGDFTQYKEYFKNGYDELNNPFYDFIKLLADIIIKIINTNFKLTEPSLNMLYKSNFLKELKCLDQKHSSY